MPFDSHKNFAQGLVAAPPSPAVSGTSMVLVTGHVLLFPAVPFNATVYPNGTRPTSNNAEIIRVVNVVADTITIVRAQESSTPRVILANDEIMAGVTVKTITDIENIAGGSGGVTIADGDDTAEGHIGDAVWTTGSGTVIALLKAIATKAISTIATTKTDGADIALGARADAAWTTGSGSAIALLKAIATKILASIAVTTADGAQATVGAKADALQQNPATTTSLIGYIKGALQYLRDNTDTGNFRFNVNTAALSETVDKVSAYVTQNPNQLKTTPIYVEQTNDSGHTLGDHLNQTTPSSRNGNLLAPAGGATLINGSATVKGFQVYNANVVDVYLAFWNVASPTLGTTVPYWYIRVPAGQYMFERLPGDGVYHSTIVQAAAVTAYNGAVAPTTGLELAVYGT